SGRLRDIGSAPRGDVAVHRRSRNSRALLSPQRDATSMCASVNSVNGTPGTANAPAGLELTPIIAACCVAAMTNAAAYVPATTAPENVWTRAQDIVLSMRT